MKLIVEIFIIGAVLMILLWGDSVSAADFSLPHVSQESEQAVEETILWFNEDDEFVGCNIVPSIDVSYYLTQSWKRSHYVMVEPEGDVFEIKMFDIGNGYFRPVSPEERTNCVIWSQVERFNPWYLFLVEDVDNQGIPYLETELFGEELTISYEEFFDLGLSGQLVWKEPIRQSEKGETKGTGTIMQLNFVGEDIYRMPKYHYSVILHTDENLLLNNHCYLVSEYTVLYEPTPYIPEETILTILSHDKISSTFEHIEISYLLLDNIQKRVDRHSLLCRANEIVMDEYSTYEGFTDNALQMSEYTIILTPQN